MLTLEFEANWRRSKNGKIRNVAVWATFGALFKLILENTSLVGVVTLPNEHNIY
jgi:hypothetical protein